MSLDYKWPCSRDFHNQPPPTVATDVSHYSSCCVPHMSAAYLDKHICGLHLFSDEGSNCRLPKLSDPINWPFASDFVKEPTTVYAVTQTFTESLNSTVPTQDPLEAARHHGPAC